MNLFKNSDFNADWSDFETDYTKKDHANGSGTVAVRSGAPYIGMGISQGHGGFSDKYLMVDGSENTHDIIWQQNVNMQAGTTYELSYWVNTNRPVSLCWQINGESTAIDTSTIEPGRGWQKVSFQFEGRYDGNHSVELRSLNDSHQGNDIALDDFSLTAIRPNLFKGGDFNGALTDFVTDYSQKSVVSGSGTLALAKNPPSFFGMSVSSGRAGDHFLMVDGSTDTNTVIWQQSIDLTAGSVYKISYWVDTNSTLDLCWQINGNSNPIDTSTIEPNNGWQQITFEFVGRYDGKHDLQLRSLSGDKINNDIALDDFSLQEISSNLFKNGGFNNGWSNFNTDYSRQAQVNAPGTVAITNKPPSFWGLGITSGRAGDQFLMVDGSTNTNAIIWQQGVELKAGSVYKISYWVNTNSSVDLCWQINGSDNPIDTSTIEKASGWQEITFEFAGRYDGKHDLQLRSLSAGAYNNDFALDDFSVIEVNQNLLINGDFKHGWSGFSTDYKKQDHADGAGTAAVRSGSPLIGMGITNGRASDNYLMVDGSVNTSDSIWKQDVELQQGSNYQVSYWVNTNSAVDLQWQVDGEAIEISSIEPGIGWQEVIFEFQAANDGRQSISLKSLNTNIHGNDIAFDDISLLKLAADNIIDIDPIEYEIDTTEIDTTVLQKNNDSSLTPNGISNQQRIKQVDADYKKFVGNRSLRVFSQEDRSKFNYKNTAWIKHAKNVTIDVNYGQHLQSYSTINSLVNYKRLLEKSGYKYSQSWRSASIAVIKQTRIIRGQFNYLFGSTYRQKLDSVFAGATTTGKYLNQFTTAGDFQIFLLKKQQSGLTNKVASGHFNHLKSTFKTVAWLDGKERGLANALLGHKKIPPSLIMRGYNFMINGHKYASSVLYNKNYLSDIKTAYKFLSRDLSNIQISYINTPWSGGQDVGAYVDGSEKSLKTILARFDQVQDSVRDINFEHRLAEKKGWTKGAIDYWMKNNSSVTAAIVEEKMTQVLEQFSSFINELTDGLVRTVNKAKKAEKQQKMMAIIGMVSTVLSFGAGLGSVSAAFAKWRNTANVKWWDSVDAASKFVGLPGTSLSLSNMGISNHNSRRTDYTKSLKRAANSKSSHRIRLAIDNITESMRTYNLTLLKWSKSEVLGWSETLYAEGGDRGHAGNYQGWVFEGEKTNEYARYYQAENFQYWAGDDRGFVREKLWVHRQVNYS